MPCVQCETFRLSNCWNRELLHRLQKTACNRAVTCHKEVLTTQSDTQYNVYYAPDVVNRMLGTERLPSELKPDSYNLMGVRTNAVKFVCGRPGVEERRSETVSLKFAWTLGPENGGAFFQKRQQNGRQHNLLADFCAASSILDALGGASEGMEDSAEPLESRLLETRVHIAARRERTHKHACGQETERAHTHTHKHIHIGIHMHSCVARIFCPNGSIMSFYRSGFHHTSAVG